MFLHHQIANHFVHVKSHLLLSNNGNITFAYFLIGNVSPDALRELLEVVEEIRLHGILAHAEEMLESTLRLLVRCVRELQHLPLMFARAACPSCQEVAKLSKC